MITIIRQLPDAGEKTLNSINFETVLSACPKEFARSAVGRQRH
jgi:hypothetical protein